MINVQRKTRFLILLSIASLGLSACSTVDKLATSLSDKPTANYHNNQSVKKLEVPPDLTAPEFDDAFALPEGVVSAVSLQKGTYKKSAKPLSDFTTNDGPASIVSISGRKVLRVNSTYEKALVSVEKTLTKLEFEKVSKSEKGDVITAKYNGKDVLLDGAKPLSFFSHVRIGGKRKRVLKFNGALEGESLYVISIKNESGASIVRVTRADGEVLTNEAHAKIMELMKTAFSS